MLGFTGLSRENDKTGTVLLDAFDIEFLSLLRVVPPPMIDNYPETLRLLLSDACLLQLAKRKSTTL